jgi:hypothetical protein
MWLPGYSRYYNETLSPVIPGALSRSVSNTFPESAQKAPGLYQARTDDIFTLMMFVRPRLQDYAKQGIQSSPVVEDLRAKMGE